MNFHFHQCLILRTMKITTRKCIMLEISIITRTQSLIVKEYLSCQYLDLQFPVLINIYKVKAIKCYKDWNCFKTWRNCFKSVTRDVVSEVHRICRKTCIEIMPCSWQEVISKIGKFKKTDPYWAAYCWNHLFWDGFCWEPCEKI